MAESAISSVSNTLGSLVVAEVQFLRGVPSQVESIKSELRSMQSFLRYADSNQSKGDARVAILVEEIRDVAYQAENVVAKINWMQRWNGHKKNSLPVFLRPFAFVSPCDLIILHKAGKEIENIKSRISDIFKRQERYGKFQLGETSNLDEEEDDLNMYRMVSPYGHCEGDVVDFDNEIGKIIKELIDPSSENLTFVSLVGMGGIGKSTLTRKVFNDPIIQKHFNILAWVSVSQNYKPIELLKYIMKRTMREITEHELENMGEQEAREKLHEFLQDKRYLIILDDVWKEKALDQINGGNTVFPDSSDGSRIMLTTRSLQVAQHTNCKNHIHKLNLLDGEQSWEFLRKKAFSSSKKINEPTLNELENIGKKLAEKCNGLPLALSVLGGYLSKNINLNTWLKLADEFDWGEIPNGEKNVVKIVALSFHDLPHYLKSCFLYMACFPEDHLISTSKLVKIWIAEGFIPYRRNFTQEKTARKYLAELADRSMVQVIEMSKTHGWIKRIRIHDILREFCIDESAKIGFIKLCNNSSEFEASASDGLKTYRLGLNKFLGKEVGNMMPYLRTIIGFGLCKPSFHGLDNIRVLELVGLNNIKKLPDEISGMIFLRYIGLRKCTGREIMIPSSIERLINLQTFDARDTRINLHSCFWKIPTLKHVYILTGTDFSGPTNGQLRNVQTLHLESSFGYCIKVDRGFIEALEEMSDISYLYLRVYPKEEILSESVCWKPFAVVLKQVLKHQKLQVLAVHEWIEDINLLHHTLFPPNLRKLKLLGARLDEDPMPTLELFPSLVVLELGFRAYTGGRMQCSARGFRRLTHMSIWLLENVVEWRIEEGSIPLLSKLSIDDCFRLKMQPEELVHLPALKELTLIDMPEFPEETCDKLEEIGCRVIKNISPRRIWEREQETKKDMEGDTD